MLTSTFGGLHDDADPDVHRLVPIHWDGGDLVCPPRLELFRSERANAHAFRRLLNDFAPDVISVWAMGAWSLGLLASAETSGLPVLYVVIDDGSSTGAGGLLDHEARQAPVARSPHRHRTRGSRRPRIVREHEHVLLRQRVHAHSCDGVAGIDPTSSSVVHAGIDTADFPIAEPDESRRWGWQILFVGRLAPEKGLDVAIRAIAQIPEARLTVVGESGPAWYHAELERVIESDGTRDRIAWTHCARNELAPMYRAGDVVVFPSTGSEAFGLVPLEAMACTTPIVATTGGGSEEYLADGENCLLFDPGDVDGLVSALQRLSQDADLRRRLVAGGLRTAAALTVDRWAESLEELHLAAARPRS